MWQRIAELKNKLITITADCYHYLAPSEAKAPYIVWNEDSEDNSLMLDNHKARQAISGYIEYYTKDEYDPVFERIQEALETIEGCSWTWEATQYGDPTQDDTNLIHHTWSWRLM